MSQHLIESGEITVPAGQSVVVAEWDLTSIGDSRGFGLVHITLTSDKDLAASMERAYGGDGLDDAPFAESDSVTAGEVYDWMYPYNPALPAGRLTLTNAGAEDATVHRAVAAQPT